MLDRVKIVNSILHPIDNSTRNSIVDPIPCSILNYQSVSIVTSIANSVVQFDR